MLKTILLALGKVLLLALVTMALGVFAEQIIPTSAYLQPAPSEVQITALMAFVVQIIFAAVFYSAAVQSELSGWRLYLALFCVYYGLGIVMAQVEAIIFIDALAPIMLSDLVQIMIKNFVMIAVSLAFLLFLTGRWRGRPASTPRPPSDIINRQLVWKVALPALVYPVFYFGFGYIVAWQFEAVRTYYAATTILYNLPILAMIQVVRGAAWVLWGLPIFLMFRSNGRAILYSVLFYSILASIVLLIPSTFMPTPVRLAHLVELASSMALFGLFVGTVMVGWKRDAMPTGRSAVAGTV